MPNGEDKKLNFVAKVLDPITKTYRPLYIAPDATDVLQGDVLLSDEADESKDAATGMTAVTPKALADAKQSVEKFAVPRSIGVKNGTAAEAKADFDGSRDITINLNNLDASTLTTGTVPLERLPQGALERLVPVENKEARFNLTKEQVQLGDIVQQLDTKEMYVVVDEDKLNEEAGYTVFSAGLASKATEADHAVNADLATKANNADHAAVSDKLGTGTIGSSIQPIYLNNGSPTIVTVAPASGNTWGTLPQIKSDGIVELGKYIHFHKANSTADYDLNLVAPDVTGITINLPSSGGTLALNNLSSTIAAGLLRQLSGDKNQVLLGDGTWGYQMIDRYSGTNLATNATTSDSTATDGKILSIPAATASTDLITKEISGLPFGMYSVILRAKTTVNTGSTEVFKIIAYANTTKLIEYSVKELDFTAANKWVSLGVGVDYNGTQGQKLKIVVNRGSYSGSAIISIDYLQIMPAPIAINAIT